MGRVGEYLTQFAQLIGHESQPRFAGMVKGSVVLRAYEQSEHPSLVRARLRDASSEDAPSNAHRAFGDINAMLAKDGANGSVIDRNKSVVVQFPGQRQENQDKELTFAAWG